MALANMEHYPVSKWVVKDWAEIASTQVNKKL